VTEIKKRLIQVHSASELDGLRFGLEKHCKNIHRPVCYINSPKDLVCQTAYVKREVDKGLLRSLQAEDYLNFCRPISRARHCYYY